jgi:adenine-specific DNA glycosylase
LRAGRVEALPVKTPKRKPTAVVHRVLAVHRGANFLWQPRPAKGLWSNMWQLPTAEAGAEDDAAASAWVAERLGLRVEQWEPVGEFSHATTHRAIRFVVRRGEVAGGRLRRGAGQWRRLDRVDDLPLAKPQLIARRMLAEA